MSTLKPETRAKLMGVSTATLATALFKRGLRNQMIQDVRPLNPGLPNMVGEAFTLRYIPAREDLNPMSVFADRSHPQRKGIEDCPPGHVFVIDSRKDPRAASAGGILVTRLFFPQNWMFFSYAGGRKIRTPFGSTDPHTRYYVILAVLVVCAIVIALIVSYTLTRHLPVMAIVSAIVVLVFGTLTLMLKDDTFIKMKPTIIYVLFGGALLGGLAFGRSLLSYVFDQMFNLTPAGWRALTLRWMAFFFAMAAVNEIVWRTQSTDFWVAFKLFGAVPLTMIFAMAQMPLIHRHTPPADGDTHDDSQ